MPIHLWYEDQNYGLGKICHLCGVIACNVPEAVGKECSAKHAKERLASIKNQIAAKLGERKMIRRALREKAPIQAL